MNYYFSNHIRINYLMLSSVKSRQPKITFLSRPKSSEMYTKCIFCTKTYTSI